MNSLLGKFMRSFTVVIFATFIFFISLLLTFINSYSLSETLKVLENGTEKLSDIATHMNETGYITEQQMRGYYELVHFYADSFDTTIIISNLEGEVVNYGSPELDFFDANLPKSVIKETVENGYYNQTGRMGNFFGKVQHIYARPYYLADGAPAGIILMSTSAEFMTKTVRDMLSIFAVGLILTLVMSYMITYFITLRITRPLKEMSEAAVAISQGKFDHRIVVKSNDEIAALADSFNMMAESLIKLDEMKSSFISNVSHELKTPMTTISGFINGILDKTIPSEKYDYYLGIISDEVNRLSRLVNTLVEVARIDSGDLKFNINTVDYTELLLNVSAQFEMKFADKNINFKLDIPNKTIFAQADYDAIYQVIYNLLDNAVKFTPNGESIIITSRVKNDKITTFIKNTGVGIKADDLPLVFDKFYKCDRSRSENKKSFGLGLFLCKYIINGHGENIYIRSEEGQYVEFLFTLNQADNRGETNDK